MLYLYYANQLTNHKDLLVNILENDPNPNPFTQETILVQSLGIAQWLQLQIAEHSGIAANLQFPYPTSFLWQQYRLLFPELPKENLFERSAIVWRLMRLIPEHLQLAEFTPLAFYLKQPDQLKLFQLAAKIADLFDQYLVYRPHWLIHWENNAGGKILSEIVQHPTFRGNQHEEIAQSITWQGLLWNALVTEIKANSNTLIFNTSHRAYLQQRYFTKLDNLSEAEKQKLPQRIFVFGITSLPPTQLAVLKKLSEHCHVHLFFTNPSEVFWGDQREDRLLEKLALNREIDEQEIHTLLENQGNPLLATWGKQGKEFLNLLLEQDPDTIVPYYEPIQGENLPLLVQIKQAILHYEHRSPFQLAPTDRSIQIHACHSKMREVEILHDQLLHLFEQDDRLNPKDIIVMSSDIDSYAPYIDAVFSRYHYQDRRYIPFTLSDQKISVIDPIINGFLTLLKLKEKRFSVDEIFDLFNIHAVRAKYQLSEMQLATLREWVQNSGIRAGLLQENETWQNYNSWENGINRLLLGSSLKAENGEWQSLVAFDESYGLSADLVGILAKFIDNLTAWQQQLSTPQTITAWKQALTTLLDSLFLDDLQSSESLALIHSTINQTTEQIQAVHFEQPIAIEVLDQVFEQALNEQRSHLHFLAGKVNFCTLLPMRAIPFKVVCLLGMNEGDFPRQQRQNSFDLMQYAHQKGDRAKRDDDRYLFLEALLSAQDVLYISYIGQSLTDNQLKLPSILISQLLDYLSQNLSSSVEGLTTYHPMTPFSPQNFIGDHFSYDNAWLQALENHTENPPFLSRLAHEESDIPTEIALDDLIAYLQDPYRFFFHAQLGVKFEQYDEALEESEIFRLDSLARYHFFDALLNVEDDNLSAYFERAKLQGNLPACYFGKLAENELIETIRPLRTALCHYLGKSYQTAEIDRQILLGTQKIRLQGNIPYQMREEIVDWRAGDLRDKDLIRAWVHFLILQSEAKPLAYQFFFRQGKEAKCLTFAPISREAAETMLKRYITDYRQSSYELSFVVNEGIGSYLEEAVKNGTTPFLNWLKSQKNPYIQRICCQSITVDETSAHQRTQDWFELMTMHADIR